MAERRSVRLDDVDLIAGAQILGWLAFPARPEHGVKTIQQWAIRRQQARGEYKGELPFMLDKPNRLQRRIDMLNRQLRRRLRAGDWLARRTAHTAGTPISKALGLGLNALARRENSLLQFQFAEQSETDRDTPNLIRDYWTASLPVIHLAKASLDAIVEAYRREGRDGWHLERTIFWPNWVADAIADSENAARWAAKLELVVPHKMIHFHRD